MLVLDASVVLNWLVDEELKPLAIFISSNIDQYELIVPPIWHLEVRNGLLAAERRDSITTHGVEERLAYIRRLSPDIDVFSDLDTAFALAKTHGLSFYDATYLELAKRRQAPLATLDSALNRATIAEDLPPLPQS